MTLVTARLPLLQVDWETLLSVNLPTLLFVIIGVPLVLVAYIVGFDVLVRRLPKRSQAMPLSEPLINSARVSRKPGSRPTRRSSA